MTINKSIITLLLCTALSIISVSCGDDNGSSSHKINKFTSVMYNHVIDSKTGDATFSVTSTHYVYDVTAVTISFEAEAKLTNGSTVVFEVPTTQMTYNSNLVCHTFNAGDITAEGGEIIKNVRGRADLRTGVIYYAFEVEDRYKAVTTPTLPMYYSKVHAVSNEDNSLETTFSEQHFTIVINQSTMKANMVINNFAAEDGMAWVDEVSYSDIPVEITADGYRLKADEVTDDDKTDKYKLTDFFMEFTEQGLKMSGSYECMGYSLSVSASMFYSALE